MPVEPRSRPLLDERRAGGPGCLLGRALLAIDRTASGGTFVHQSARPASKPRGGRRDVALLKVKPSSEKPLRRTLNPSRPPKARKLWDC